MEKQSNLSRLLNIAGNHKYLIYASWVLSAVSAFIALVPYCYIWKIIREVLDTRPDFSNGQDMAHNGWMAVLFAVVSYNLVVYTLSSSDNSIGILCAIIGFISYFLVMPTDRKVMSDLDIELND